MPVSLATFPLLAGISQAHVRFNIVFFVVLTSVLLQGTSIPFVSRLLRVDAPLDAKKKYPIEFEHAEGVDASLTDLIVPYQSEVVGKTVAAMNVPPKALIVLVSRGDTFVVPNGSTVIEGGDVLLVLGNDQDIKTLQRTLSALTNPRPSEEDRKE